MYKITDVPDGSRDLKPTLAPAKRQLNGNQALPRGSDTPQLPEPRFKLLGSAELRALPPIEWLIRDILPTKGVATIYGPSASGKTFLVFDMAAAIAGGTNWFGFRVAPTPTVLIVLEGEAGLPYRAAAWEAHNQRELPRDMHIVLQTFKLTNRKDVQDMAASVPAGAVIFIDTLNRAAPTIDENSSKDMGEVLEAARQLQALTGGMVILVHHSGKDASKGPRGHSSQVPTYDSVIEVSRDGDRRQWRASKSKDGPAGALHPFKLAIEPLGVDKHGDLNTSCVVVPDATDSQIKHVRVPQGANQRMVLDILRPMFNQGERAKAGAPPQALCIELEAAISSVSKQLTCETFRRTTRAREAISGLVAKGVFGCSEGWIWVV